MRGNTLGVGVPVAPRKAEPKIADKFRSGAGLDWCEHEPTYFEGTERFFRPNYAGNLVNSRIPALEGVEGKLKKGAKVADAGCGHGSFTLLMAKAYPNSRFFGFDYHEASIQAARRRGEQTGIGKHVQFDAAARGDLCRRLWPDSPGDVNAVQPGARGPYLKCAVAAITPLNDRRGRRSRAALCRGDEGKIACGERLRDLAA